MLFKLTRQNWAFWNDHLYHTRKNFPSSNTTLLTGFLGLWPPPAFGSFRLRLATFGYCWLLLANFGNFWQLFGIFGNYFAFLGDYKRYFLALQKRGQHLFRFALWFCQKFLSLLSFFKGGGGAGRARSGPEKVVIGGRCVI